MRMQTALLTVVAMMPLAACDRDKLAGSASDYRLTTTARILVTSEGGDKLASRPDVAFVAGRPAGIIIDIDPAETRQTLLGIGTSFTESSAFVLAHLEEGQRADVMQQIFGEQGANFSMARTAIGSTDFTVEGRYSYAAVEGDTELANFSIGPDQAGFSRRDYPGIKDESYDVLPMIKEALAIKSSQPSGDLRIVASAWTAPPWMKTIDTWFVKPAEENNWQGTGGDLKPEFVSTYADYLVRYLDAYQNEGVDIWGLTPVNEPHGNSGQWESMHFTPATQRDFIRTHLGPRLQQSGHSAVKLLVYDQNRDGLEKWADVILADAEAAEYVYGIAVHWYSSTNKVYEDVFERVHARFPEFSIVHTEGTVDDLGKPAPDGIGDPEKFTESGWFGNDAFWWNANATDWAYTAPWAQDVDLHPAYTPVHRYARDIIVGFNHWLEGWIDWNIVLDANGGPNHVGNFCGAPIMIDTETGEVYYTPVYFVLAQLSRTIRPGDIAVRTKVQDEGLVPDALHASASINDQGLLSVQVLNTTKEPIDFALRIGNQYADIEIEANALQTVQVELNQ